MTVGDWLSTSQNWVFLAIALPMLFAAVRVVTTRNVVHAVLFLVITLGASAALFVLVGAEYVAWTVVLVYIGAVVVLFLFGTMITRAPLGMEVRLSHPTRVKVSAAVVAFALFALLGGAMLEAFGGDAIAEAADATRTSEIGELMFTRYVVPFEVVSVLLLAALIGGIVLARRDPDQVEEGRL